MIGVILAGGASRRMGGDKALLAIEGRRMVDWVADGIGNTTDRIVVCGRTAIDGYEAIPDLGDVRKGPLAGLVAAFERYPSEPVFLTAVDQPWLQAGTVTALAERLGDLTVAPVDGGVRQITCAVYPPAIARIASDELAGGGSLQSLLDVAAFDPVTDWTTVGEDGRSWFSVDTPGDLEMGYERFGPPGDQPPM